MQGTPITIIGNLGNDPELRFTPSGAAVASFSVAVAEQRFNRETSKYEDSGTTWYRVNVWRSLAEGVAESLTKGMRVIVTGTIAGREWTDQKTNEKRVSWEIQATSAGPDLTWATAKVTRNTKNGGDQAPPPEDPRGTGSAVHRTRPAAQTGAPADDPWASHGNGGGYTDEPPF